jgi:hypothetical protein
VESLALIDLPGSRLGSVREWRSLGKHGSPELSAGHFTLPVFENAACLVAVGPGVGCIHAFLNRFERSSR